MNRTAIILAIVSAVMTALAIDNLQLRSVLKENQRLADIFTSQSVGGKPLVSAIPQNSIVFIRVGEGESIVCGRVFTVK